MLPTLDQDYFPSLDKNTHSELLEQYFLKGTDVIDHLKNYVSIKNTDKMIGRIPPTVAIIITAYHIRVTEVYRYKESQILNPVQPLANYAIRTGELIKELAEIRNTFESQMQKLYRGYDLDNLAVRKNGFIVEAETTISNKTAINNLTIAIPKSLFKE